MSDADPELLNHAAVCYQAVGERAEAARCYREAGSHRRAAELHEGLDRFRDAAFDHARSENIDQAAWLLVHRVGDPVAARTQLAAGPAPTKPAPVLRRRLVLARCDAAEGRPPKAALAALADVAADLSRPRAIADPSLETWAVAVADALGRPDQTALLFAAAVRGGLFGAEQRWRAWMRTTLNAELILPARR